MFRVLEYSEDFADDFADGQRVSQQGIHRNGDLCSFLTASAVGHPGELQESGLGCTNQALEEAVFIWALLKPGSKSVLSFWVYFFSAEV